MMTSTSQSPSPLRGNCDDWEEYTIQQGDTLYSLSVRYGIPLRVLMACNKMINPYHLSVGQVIRVPSAPPAMLGCTGEKDEVYIVKLKDTLYQIAESYDTTVEELIKRNPGLDPYNLKPGLRICVPKKEAVPNPPQQPPVVSPPASGGETGGAEDPDPDYFCDGKTYTVAPGDTLSALLTNINYTYAALVFANPNVDLGNLTEGMPLCIPRQDNFAGSQCATTYVVKYADSLPGLARKFNVTENQLLQANPFCRPTDFAMPGTKICIPEL